MLYIYLVHTFSYYIILECDFSISYVYHRTWPCKYYKFWSHFENNAIEHCIMWTFNCYGSILLAHFRLEHCRMLLFDVELISLYVTMQIFMYWNNLTIQFFVVWFRLFVCEYNIAYIMCKLNYFYQILYVHHIMPSEKINIYYVRWKS